MCGLGADGSWAMIWAKAAGYHGRLIFRANGEQRGMNVSYVGRYVGLVQNRIKNMSLLTIGVNRLTAMVAYLRPLFF